MKKNNYDAQLFDLKNEILLHLYSTQKRRNLIAFFSDEQHPFAELLEEYDRVCAKVSAADAKFAEQARWSTYDTYDTQTTQRTEE